MSNPKLLTRRTALMAALLMATTAAQTQTPSRYVVEIVVFRSSSQTGTAPASDTVKLAGENDIETTSVASRRLGAAANRLRATAGYKILAHTAWSQGPAGWNSRRGVAAASVGLAKAGLSGKVILERGQYLHLGVDLTLEEGGKRFHLSELRRVKVNETQYFDHPAIGVLAVVTPAT